MEASPSAPLLLDTIERLLARERSRRRDTALRRALLATTLAIVIVALWRVGDRVYARQPMPAMYAAGLVAATFLAGVAVTLRRAFGGDESSMARELDRRLGLSDRATSALAVVRGGTNSRLAQYMVNDAETALGVAAARIDIHFPAAAARRRFLTVRRLAVIAAVAIVLALFAELLTVGGPLRWLPGTSPDATKDPADDAPPDETRPGGGPGGHEKPDRPTPPKPDDPKEEPKPATPEGDVRVTLKMAKDEYGPDEPVASAVSAAATGPRSGAKSFDVRIAVDDEEIDAGVGIDVDQAGSSVGIDLAKIPGLHLGPGEHTARARLTTRTDREEHVSPPVKFKIRDKGGQSGDDQNGQKPKPQEPQPQPQEQKPPPKPEPKEGPAGAPPPPPVALDRKVVMPLFGEGDLVKKKGPVLVLDPGGGSEAPPERKPVGDALPEAKKRAESAVDQARLSEADRALVRRYFELLEGLRR